MSEDSAGRGGVSTTANQDATATRVDAEGSRPDTGLMGRFRNLSFSSRLALAVMAVTVASLVVTAAVSITSGEELADEVVEQRLETQLVLEADQVEQFLNSTRNQTVALAQGAAFGELSRQFTDAYEELGNVDDAVVGSAETRLSDFYRDTYVPELNERTGSNIQWPELLPTEDAALYLQDAYVVTDRPGSLDALLQTDAGDGSTWSEIHAEAQPGILELIDRLGVEDLYLIDPTSGAIVYSAAKRPDFATNLDSGPYSGSHLAALMRTIRANPEPGTAVVSDISAYGADLGGPVGFIGAPVFDGDEFVAILVVDLPVATLNSIMTSDEQWEQLGLGETGESFLLGTDGRMRTDSRKFIEDQAGYVELVEAAGTATSQELAAMTGVGTTITFQKVIDPVTLTERAESLAVIVEPSNYLGVESFTGYEALDVEDVDWYVATQVGREELEAGELGFRRDLLIAVAVFVILIAFGTVAWARGLFAPVRAIGSQLLSIHRGEAPKPAELPARTAHEFAMLRHSVDQMLQATHERQEEVSAASGRKLATLRSLLPRNVAERVETGDRDVLDHVPQASIAVLVLHGLGALVHSSDPIEGRKQLDELVAHIDDAARRHGVEPIKLVGDAYLVGCGVGQPFLDHAPRVLAFAVEARELVRDVAEQMALQASIGIHTGPVSVGLTGSSNLIYDVWGDTVDVATSLARSAPPGALLISEKTRSMLPRDVQTSRWGEAQGEDVVWEVEERGIEERISG